MAKSKVSIKQDSEKPIEKEILAKAIIRISESVTSLKASGINKKAIIALVHDDTKLSKRDLSIFLDSLSELRSKYCS